VDSKNTLIPSLKIILANLISTYSKIILMMDFFRLFIIKDNNIFSKSPENRAFHRGRGMDLLPNYYFCGKCLDMRYPPCDPIEHQAAV